MADTYNPRTGTPASEDDDADGLPDVCDTNDLDGNFDPDGDGWENGHDNCPLNANSTQADSEQTVAHGTTAPSGGRCGPGGVAADPPSTAWPLDFKHAGIFPTRINIADLNAMLGGATANPKMFNNNRALGGPRCTGL